MQVSKWGNSLAVRLPRAVVEALKLKEGDDIEIIVAGTRAFEVSRDRKREEALKRVSVSFAASCYRPDSSSTGKRRMPGADVFFDTNVLLYLVRAIRQKRIAPNGLLRSVAADQRAGP